MSYVATQGKFHVALDGVGLLLQGAPDSPAYKMTNAPVYGTRFASGDRDYNDLSQWWYLIQTDWSGGIKDTVSFLDDAKFYYSSNIDARTKPGTIRLEHQLEQVYDNSGSSDEILDLKVMTINDSARTHFIDAGDIRTTGGTAAFDSDGSPTDQLAFKNYMWLFGTTIANSNTALPYPFVINSQTSNFNGVITGSIGTFGDVMACTENGVLYVATVNDAGSICVAKTTVANPASSADWTLVAEFPIGNSLGASVTGLKILGGELVLLAEGSPSWYLYTINIATNAVSELKEFQGCTQHGIYVAGNRYLQKFFNTILITILSGGSDDEDGEIWGYDGSDLTLLYKTDEAKEAFSTLEAKPFLRGGCVVYDNYAWWGNLALDSAGRFYNTIKNYTDTSSLGAIPIGQDGDYLYFVDNLDVAGDDQTYLYRYSKNSTTYKDGANHEAFLVFNQHDKLQSIDKLLNTITLGFEKLVSGQEINIYYSTNPVPDPDITTGSWTLLGVATYAIDGGTVTAKVLPFPVGTTAKKIWFRAELVSGGTNTPGLTDFTLEYLPVPDYKKQWQLSVNCADELKRLDGQQVETSARELKSRLEKMWWTKSALDFQDLDYATTLVNDASFDASETTVTVDSTANFPEQGRLKVDDEEILYTGKTATTFTGCTRGARGTRATTHADDSVINNAYRVIVMGVEAQAPVLLEDKHLEYVVGLSLREV